MIKLFEVDNKIIKPTEHCYQVKYLKDIMDIFPEDYMSVYAFIFYMSCPNDDVNPFFEVKEEDKEEIIYNYIEGNFSLEDPIIMDAIEKTKKLYETPSYRGFIAMKKMIDRLSEYLENTPIEHGRDGNIDSIIKAGEKLPKLQESYNNFRENLKKEQMVVRGGKDLAYDQRNHKTREDELFNESE
jgi:hypothetical protein